ncbi:MAG TPA: hypothetical protein DET40_25225 [Lentisphaeria bacterium]|nr:MAG: hypothetical protein A2X45_18740 [Lentisphaerae bacterium GWF2_50_93]HCE46863.1 hypothetical protein [Lentisphaeria bacterium]
MHGIFATGISFLLTGIGLAQNDTANGRIVHEVKPALGNNSAKSSLATNETPLVKPNGEKKVASALPRSYDLRDLGLMTPVRSQVGNFPSGKPDPGNSIGICWAMSSISVFESNLLKHGITKNPVDPASSFSAWHLGNAVSLPPLHYNDPCYIYYPDPINIPLFFTDPPTAFGYLSPDSTNGWGGGDAFWMLDCFLSGKGPVYEASAPVPVDEMTAHKKLEWTNPDLPPADFILRGVYQFSRNDYPSLAEFRLAAKQAIVDYGAIQTAMLVLPGDLPYIKGLTFYNPKSNCIYCPRANLEKDLNHSITIAGWNDDFAVEGAPAPGAWLIRESLGTNCYDKGYHWIAYEDQTFMRGDADFLAVTGARGAPYRWPGLLTHPGILTRTGLMATTFLSTGSSMWGKDSQCYARFNSGQAGKLTAIGLATLSRGEDVSIKIFSGVDAQFNPINLIGSKQVKLDKRGYHLVDLDTPVDIGAESVFYVSLNFAYHDQKEPLAYCIDKNIPAGDTYILQYTATKPSPSWVPMTKIIADSSIFVQAIFSR